ncbi:MAG: HAMP domain-containing protein [Nanoarchaeota archaeon]|nr:HAMP domain-containing protein [Nanoarchaeota archaeon]
MKLSLNNKISMSLLLIIFISTIVLGSIIFIQGSRIIEERTKAQLESVVALKENQLNDFISEEKGDLISIAKEKYFVDLYKQLIQHHEIYGEHLESYHDTMVDLLDQKISTMGEDFVELFVLDMNGIVHISTEIHNTGKIKSNEAYFTQGQKQTSVQSFYYDLTLQQPSMVISTPVHDNNGSLMAVLVGRIDLNQISDLMTQREGLGQTGETYLVNKYNYIVTKSRFIEGIEFKKTIHTDAVKDCLEQHSGSLKYNDYRDVPVIGVYRWIPERNICLIAEFDQSEAFEPINTLRNIIFFVGIGVFVLALMIGLWISKTITDPIIRLRNAAKEIGEGNFDVKIKNKGGDEIGELSESFTEMAQQLAIQNKKILQHENDLHDQVDQRTKELQIKLLELENTKLAVMNILEDTDETNKSLMYTKEELKKKIEELKLMDQKKDEFLSVTAHELKTPLTSIRGFADLLRNPAIMAKKEQRDKYFNIIIDDTKRLEKLITDILDLSRLDLGTMKFNFEKTRISSVFEGLKDLSEIPIKDKGLKPIFVIGEKIPDFNTDVSRLLQVLTNLINNAIKYTEKGSIKVEAKKQRDDIFFSVTDTGVGIPESEFERIFNRFYQVDSSYTRKVGGSGLGLAVSKGIVEALGGSIRVDSVIGKGTTFSFNIPLNSYVKGRHFESILHDLEEDGNKTGATKNILMKKGIVDQEGFLINNIEKSQFIKTKTRKKKSYKDTKKN